MSDNFIKFVENEGVARIILSKPPLNILGIAELKELTRLIDRVKAGDYRVLILESDQKVFSAGVDIKEHTTKTVKELLEAFHNVFFKMLELEIPTISLVKAGCIGGGCELAVFSDFVLASENAYFSQPEIKVGCFPPVSMVYFPYLTGAKKALEMILTGEKVCARDAERIGLVNHVFSEEKFEEDAQNFIDSILKNRPDVIKTTLNTFKKLNYAELKEKIKICEKIYLEKIEHDKIVLK